MAITTLGDVARSNVATLEGKSRDVAGVVFRLAVAATLYISVLIVVILVMDVVTDGWDQLSSRLGGFLSGTLRSRSIDDQLGVHQGLYGSFWVAAFVAIIAFPTGVASAVYLEEYARRNRVTNFIELAIRNLSGVPSVVYGLLGLFLFVEGNTIFGFIGLDWIVNITGGSSPISAGLTLAILVLPIVIITAQEAIRAVPSGLKEGAYGVGATKSEMIRTQVLPYAAPGILTGTLLSMSRAIGEAAPLLLIGAISGGLTANPSFLDVTALQDRFTALPILIVKWVSERGRDEGFATAAAAAIVVLLAVVLALNMTAILLRNRFENKRG
ncbi:MAG: phosphate ABC transporter permease PstA [Actinomycetota bacterium]|nr:phosphate ABC transporter permease PstA [Actinomycetota bacterium]